MVAGAAGFVSISVAHVLDWVGRFFLGLQGLHISRQIPFTQIIYEPNDLCTLAKISTAAALHRGVRASGRAYEPRDFIVHPKEMESSPSLGIDYSISQFHWRA